MSDKEYLYAWKNEDMMDLKGIVREAFRKADELYDKLIDAKTILEEIS